MSLQVWLPLNGNLQNKGIGEFSTSTTSVTYSTNGKIGNKCLTSQISSISVPNMIGKKQMSFAYWVKIITATSTNWLDSFRWYSTDGTNDQSSRQEFYTNSTLTGIWFKADSSGVNSISGKTNVVGEWRHYAATLDYQTGDVKFYINGSLVGSTKSLDTSHYIKGTNFLLHENNLDHAINDFRLYDHVLSLKEIKEISKGLVLHYPLDNNGLGDINSNLVIGYDDTTVYDCSGYQNNGIANNITYSTDTPKYLSSSQFTTANTSYIKVNENNWMAQHAKEMTINFWAYAEDWTTQTSAHLFSCTDSGGFNTQKGNSGYLRFSVYVCTNEAQTSYAYKYDSQQLKLADLTPGWHMFTYIYQASSGTKVYIDTKLHHTYNNVSYGIRFNTGTRLFLGCQAATANPSAPYFNGKESDFRLYYTVLSDQDISQLYYISALVDRNSNFYISGSYIENDLIKITHSGNSFSQQINEDSENKIYYLRDKSLHGNNFIQK